ncbi:hypothetical protein [Mongoliimonas terrestris]|uniref:hypothetical protein n=1 Tax=Mongoliimonas terrestris TaxID=1709001 RepID=UPI00094953EF|nr:hypothetical protein [Mongoliimonas terrestris]
MAEASESLKARSGSEPDKPGLVRFEVFARPEDRDLLRRLAERLATPGADDLRSAITRQVADQAPDEQPFERGGIVRAMRASPLVGSGLDLVRDRHPGRLSDL